MTDTEICGAAVRAYGEDTQIMTAIEEMAELTQALSKNKRYPDNLSVLENIAEEIADVRIMLDQLELIFNCSDVVENYRVKKIHRLADRIKKLSE